MNTPGTDHLQERRPRLEQRAPRRRRTTAMLGHNAYALLALPTGLAGLAAALSGDAARVGRAQRTLARRLLGVPLSGATPSRRQVLRFSLAGLPANLVTFGLLGPAWAVFITRGVLYPVFGADHLDRSWGGPTLAGAWVAHFIQGPPLLFVITLVLWPISRHQARLARRHLGA
jgi:hypothetical protein